MCQAAVELMTDYLEGALSPRKRARFERHLDRCPPCARLLDQVRTTSEVLALLGPEGLEPEVRERLVALYRAR